MIRENLQESTKKLTGTMFDQIDKFGLLLLL